MLLPAGAPPAGRPRSRPLPHGPATATSSIATAVAACRLPLTPSLVLNTPLTPGRQEHHNRALSKDTWAQLLDFVRTISPDFSNFDESAAWPYLLDEFVEYARARRAAGGAA